MLDLEYLLQEPRLERHVVYAYRSGVLRSQMTRRLADAAGKCGLGLYHHGLEALYTGSLLEGVLLFEGADLAGLEPPHAAGALLGFSEQGGRFAVFAHQDDKLLPHLDGLGFVVIKEQQITSPTVDIALSYFAATSDIVVDRNIAKDLAFRGHFLQFVSRLGAVDLPRFAAEFDITVLRWTNVETGVFTRPNIAEGGAAQRAERLRPLRAFVMRGRRNAFVEFVQGLDRQRRAGASTRQLITTVFELTIRLIEGLSPEAQARKPRSRRERGESALIWGATVLCWSARLLEIGIEERSYRLNVDRFLYMLDQLAREFAGWRSESEPLLLLLARVRMATSPPPENIWVSRLIDALVRTGASSRSHSRTWVGTLTALLEQSAETGASVPTIVAAADIPVKARSINDIIGQEEAVRVIRDRLRASNHSTPLLLHGPTGTGKRTVATVYARAILCEGALSEGLDPCGRCEACQSFEQAGSFGFIQINAARDTALEYIREQLLWIRFLPFAKHRILLIESADRAPRLVDSLLKTLEADIEFTTFIFSAKSLSGLRGAGLSRSQACAVSPLGEKSARELVRMFLRDPKSRCNDEHIIDLLLAAGGGIAARLHDVVERVQRVGCSTLEQAKQVLDLNWGEGALESCQRLMERELTDHGRFCVPTRNEKERVQSALVELQRIGDGASSPLTGAFVGLEKQLAETYRLLCRVAERRARTQFSLLQSLSDATL